MKKDAKENRGRLSCIVPDWLVQCYKKRAEGGGIPYCSPDDMCSFGGFSGVDLIPNQEMIGNVQVRFMDENIE